MSHDTQSWQIRLFILLAIGGSIAHFLQSSLFGMFFGFSGDRDNAMFASLASSAGFAILGFFFEALPVTFFGRPKASSNSALTQKWRSGFLLAWLAMTLTSVLILATLHFFASKSAALPPRWTYMGISLIATAASSYAFIFTLNLRFAQNDWPTDWQLPAWILMGGLAALNIAMSFAYGALNSSMMVMMAIGIVSQLISAGILVFALGVWREGIERGGTPSGGYVF
jgi:uncharacterized membrane protein YdcZ (DUF606 family)